MTVGPTRNALPVREECRILRTASAVRAVEAVGAGGVAGEAGAIEQVRGIPDETAV